MRAGEGEHFQQKTFVGSIDQRELLNNAHLGNSLTVGFCKTEEVAG